MQRTRTRDGSGRIVVVDAAISCFTERGYHATTMRDIASGAGITVASIYHYYASKQEILQDIMTTTMKATIELTRDAVLDAGSSPADQLSAAMYAWVIFHTTRQPEALIGASELRSLEDDGFQTVTSLRHEQEIIFRSVIERGVRVGDFHTAHPGEAARAALAMGANISSWYRADTKLSPEELADRYCALILGTVRASDAIGSA
ncbi:TetR/AcrR family transcriptional regulator [Gordonia hydrophobica]|uniref:TetR/AcrR family transcriptional regulator n=1 Tax=Gordonia hydrophobica TaxID=40516 RepID=A0ABZ2TWB1_9ACTN|nr:TetR/AcrR family transcriptional regulator [Gordonia hydrophobica]MBM7365811.1 AcrR family transcriptional regulator [Gordonia hydrophobica]